VIPIAAPAIGETEQRRVRDVLESGRLAAGEEVAAFESAFAARCGVGHGVATANGTAALHTALHALGVGDGDRVVTTPFSFVATANAIRMCGAEPVFADVDPETLNLDPDAVEAALTRRDVAAVLVVHLFGQPARMDRFEALADEHDCLLLEDAAQAHGAAFDGRPVGSFGDAATFSFYPTKNITTGEGGMVVTDDPDVAERAARFVDHGRTEGYTHESLGYNYRMTDMAAAIGCAQLEKLPELTAARRANARRLTAALGETQLTPPVETDPARHVYHQYTVRCAHRDALREHLAERGVDSGIYYPVPIHEQPAYDGFEADAPVAERAAEEVLSVPVHPGLSASELETVTGALRAYERPGRVEA
jgi:dTDP-4-amino-4,6-dideoxygalactose transaminase